MLSLPVLLSVELLVLGLLVLVLLALVLLALVLLALVLLLAVFVLALVDPQLTAQLLGLFVHCYYTKFGLE